MKFLTYLATGVALAYGYLVFSNMQHLFYPASAGPKDIAYENLLRDGDAVDIYVYVSTSGRWCTDFRSSVDAPLDGETATDACYLVWRADRFLYGFHNESLKQRVTLRHSHVQNTRKGKPLFVHTLCTRSGYDPDPKRHRDEGINWDNVYASVGALTRMMVPFKTAKNLLETISQEGNRTAEERPRDAELHITTSVSMSLVYDETRYPLGQFPGDVAQFAHWASDRMHYKPIVYFNEFWLSQEHFVPAGEIPDNMTLQIDFSTMSLGKFRLTAQYHATTSALKDQYGFTDNDIDALRDLVTKNSPTVLALTLFVSLLHMLFDFLAFKNDITYWKKRRNMQGISVRSVVLQSVSQWVVLLYLLDNETSLLVSVPVGIQAVIDTWKVQKALKISIRWRGYIPTGLVFGQIDKSETETEEADLTATRYMTWALFPLMAFYAVYSLVYDKHRGWYSWLLSMLTGYIYAFGFVMMCPQLFINYRLKSVAHLPWRALCYKAFNTFIDDVFAFIIHMPTMHRIACFRDDLVFFCFLYQLWIYPVDNKRVNEYGLTGEDFKDSTIEKYKSKNDDKDQIIAKNKHLDKILQNQKSNSEPSI